MKDIIAKLIEFLFSEDKKKHPMPPERANDLQCSIQKQLHNNSLKNKEN